MLVTDESAADRPNPPDCEAQDRETRGDLSRFAQIIGTSAALERVLEQVQRVAPTDATVLVLGETGTGKELIAQATHQLSPRCGRAFVKLNCAAIPLDLLESELFGHEKARSQGRSRTRLDASSSPTGARS